jgi:hypothetical protein
LSSGRAIIDGMSVLGDRRRGATVRGAIAAIAATALALLAAACGGSQASRVAQAGSTASSPQTGAVAFSRCMRTHGISSFPDPDSSGAIPKVALERLGVSSARFRAAQQACDQLLPNGGGTPSQAQMQRVKALGLAFARCVRAHGVPSFPDPGSDGRIPDPATAGVDQGSPSFQAANDACAKYRPPYLPSNAAYDAWAATQSGGS